MLKLHKLKKNIIVLNFYIKIDTSCIMYFKEEVMKIY